METMHKPTEFISSVDIWTNEITGNIARVNDTASALEFDLYKPTATNNRIDIGNRILIAGNFIKALNVLYKNVSQVLPQPIKKEVGTWLREVMIEMMQKGNLNQQQLLNGIAVAERLQDELYNIGLKEIGVDDPIEFPYEFYEELVT
jgi:hypothetical protein